MRYYIFFPPSIILFNSSRKEYLRGNFCMMPAMDLVWLDKLERKIGFISIPGLVMFIAGMHAIIGT